MSFFTTESPTVAEATPAMRASRQYPENIHIRGCDDFLAVVKDGDNLVVHDSRDFEVQIDNGGAVSVDSCTDFQITPRDDRNASDDFTDTSLSSDPALGFDESVIDQLTRNGANRSIGAVDVENTSGVNGANSNTRRDISDLAPRFSTLFATTLTSSDPASPYSHDADDKASSNTQQGNNRTTFQTPWVSSDLGNPSPAPTLRSITTRTQPISIPAPTNTRSGCFYPTSAGLGSYPSSNAIDSSPSSDTDEDETDSNFPTSQTAPVTTTTDTIVDDPPSYDQATDPAVVIDDDSPNPRAPTPSPQRAFATRDDASNFRTLFARLSTPPIAPTVPAVLETSQSHRPEHPLPFDIAGRGFAPSPSPPSPAGEAAGGGAGGWRQRRGAISEQGGREPVA